MRISDWSSDVCSSDLDHIVDKGADKGALLYSTRKISDDATGTLLASVTQVSFLRGDGGCGGPSLPPRAPHQVPSSAADECAVLETRPEQALIYRLSALGRASCKERDCPYGSLPVVAVALKKIK